MNTEKTGRDKIFNFRPVFFCALFLCLGIFFAYLRICYGVSAWWILLCLPVVVTPFCFCENKKRIIPIVKGLLALFLSFLVGFLAFSYQTDAFDDCPRYEGNLAVIGKVEERVEYDGLTKLVVSNLYVEENKTSGKLQVYLTESLGKGVKISDKVLLKGYVQTRTELWNDYGLRGEAIAGKIRYEMTEVENCMVTGRSFDPFAWARERMISVIYQGMDATSASVTVAILTGDTSGIETGLLENVRYGGIAHIFAVSGLHIGALYAFCILLYQKTPLKKLSKTVRFILLATLLIFYAGICGFSASVLRAVVLCLTLYAFTLLLLKTDFLESLGLAAIVVLLLSPMQLFAVGFQLSFGACLGIAFLNRPILSALERGYAYTVSEFMGKWGKKILQRSENEDLPPTVYEQGRRAVFSFLAVSLSAQIATAPILLETFGYLSGWGLLLNGIFVPLISATFSFLLLFVGLACVLPIGLSALILYIPKVLLTGCLLLFETVDFSGFALTGIRIAPLSISLYALACTLFSDKWNLSKGWRIATVTICLSAFCLSLIAFNI